YSHAAANPCQTGFSRNSGTRAARSFVYLQQTYRSLPRPDVVHWHSGCLTEEVLESSYWIRLKLIGTVRVSFTRAFWKATASTGHGHGYTDSYTWRPNVIQGARNRRPRHDRLARTPRRHRRPQAAGNPGLPHDQGPARI